MEIKRIVVCGDSFCTEHPPLPNTHFSELLGSKYNYEVTNLAWPGMSNTAICFQIEQAIKLNPDFVIFANTDVSRIDIPTKKFETGRGLKNFVYSYDNNLGAKAEYVGGRTANVYSNTIPSFLDSRPDLPDSVLQNNELIKAIKYYVNFLFDYEFNAQTNEWMIGYWVYKLKEHNIQHLWINRDPMWEIINKFIRNNPDEIGKVTYHTDPSAQLELTEKIKEYIDKISS